MTVFLATIKDGYELDFGSEYNLARWHDFCKANIGKTIRLDRPQSSRTLSQNRFYWHYLRVIANETGNSEEDLHIFFSQKLLPRRFIKIKGRKNLHEIEARKSTTTLNKIEFGEYLEKICALSGVPIPDPVAAGYFH